MIRSNNHSRHHGVPMALTTALLLAACSSPPPAEPAPDPTRNELPAPAPTNTQTRSLTLKNGVATYLEVAPRGSDTQVQLAVLAGSVFVAPGLAELAANVLLESSDPTAGRPSLRHRIEALGGTIDAKIGLMTTWFDIRVQSNGLAKAIIALRESLDSVTQSRSQIERMRSDLIATLAKQLDDQPLREAARMLLHGERGTGTYLSSLIDLDPSEVSLFHSRLYRPERCLLAISSPNRMAEIQAALLKPAATAIAQWKPAPAVPGASPIVERQFESGLYWASTLGRPNTVHAAFVMRLPDATAGLGAAEWLVMHSCLTLGGRGGRLERMQDEAGLTDVRWQTHIERTPDAIALVMSTTVPHNEATSLWRVLNRARQSLIDVPPTPSELQLALRRARLNADLPNLSSGERLRLAANLKTRGIAPSALKVRLEQLSDLNAWDPAKAAVAFQETPAWMIAIGPGDAPEAPGLLAFELRPKGFQASSESVPTPTAIAATGPWLGRARAAMGGRENFSNLTGFTSTGTIVADKSPDATDTIEWSQSGKLTRQRQIVGQTLTTKLAGNNWSESLGKVRKSLNAREAKLLRHQMMRHPLMLLAANQSGTLQFRPIAQRSSGDRELMVLEAVGNEFDRLRIHIDTESHLIRIVESWERLPDETLVHVRESWSDYRAAGAMRAPYRRRTTWNDGEHQTETVFSKWLPAIKN
ncbi:MAG: putative Zn-dependent peptidase [Planctomycetota bacterium]